MQAGEGEEESGTGGQTSGLSAVQGLPWWGGGGQQSVQSAPSGPVKSLFVEHPTGATSGVGPLGFTHSHALQHAAAPVLIQSEGQGSSARMHPLQTSGYEEGRVDEQQQHATALPVLAQPPVEYSLPRTQLELGHSMVRAVYPYTDPYFGGLVAAYGAQAMVHPHILGVQQARMPLPSEITEEEPVYVNAKQYHGILRRRQSRAKAESENKLIKSRKPYLHESRHLHAMRRARGLGGRFLNTKNKDEFKSNVDGNVSSEGQSSQESTSSESHEMQLESCLMGSQSQGAQTVQSTPSRCMGEIISGAGYHPGMLGHPMMPSGVQGGYHIRHQNQNFHSVFHPIPGGNNEGDSSQGGGIMPNGSQQRAVATQ